MSIVTNIILTTAFDEDRGVAAINKYLALHHRGTLTLVSEC